MKRIAIPVYENRISNRLDCSKTIILYNLYREKVESVETIILAQKNATAKLNMLLDLGIDVLICNGITDFYYNKLSKNNVQVIPWINGEVEDVMDRYLKGRLHSIECR